jgi:hypothetical protein
MNLNTNKSMNYSELQAEIKSTELYLSGLKEKLKTTFPTLEEAQPGDKLDDGCVVIYHRPKSILYNERLLVAAPEKTEVECQWTPEFKPVFDKLKSHGFDPSDWFIPSVEQLRLAYINAKQQFWHQRYWSSTEASSTNACCVDFNDGSQFTASKAYTGCVRAFRFVEL